MEHQMEDAVLDRYTKGAIEKEAALCCPVSYNPEFLKNIPSEIIEKDYGCGDPTPYLKAGDTVLDLGSGAGKICYIASQLVGKSGKVIGLDMNDEMLGLAQKYLPEFAQTVGYNNVSFQKGKIQDLALNLDEVDHYLKANPTHSSKDLVALNTFIQEQKNRRPLIADSSIDCIVSNCVLNLVNEAEKKSLFAEIFRVLKRGGRVAISDIVADESVPTALKQDADLWSGCISGAMTETGFLKAFEEVGFYGIDIVKRSDKPWQTVQGYEFRSVVVTAWKGKEGPCKDHHQAVIYKGPFSQICDDDGHVYHRGERMSVCEKTRKILSQEPYRDHFYFVDPLIEVSPEQAKDFDCHTPKFRHPRITKGKNYQATEGPNEGCEPSAPSSSSCC